MFTIDGIEWDVPCQINRIAEVRSSEISGMLLDKSYFNDVLGTWLQYDVSLAVPFGKENQYTRIYEILTDPVDGHTVVMPYNQGEITITGRIVQVRDEHYRLSASKRYWAGISFSIIANHPTKNNTLDGVIVRGLAPLPPVGGAQTGVLYMYTGTGWEQVEYENADNKSY